MRSQATGRGSDSSPRPHGRNRSLVTEALTKGVLPPQFDVDGLITTGSWQTAKTSSMRTALQDTPVVLGHKAVDWRRFAACRGNPEHVTALMFAHTCNHDCAKSKGKKCDEDPTVIESRTICASCPVLDYCRWWATVTNLTHGMAGAMTQAQRLVIRKQLRHDPIGNALLEGRIELDAS